MKAKEPPPSLDPLEHLAERVKHLRSERKWSLDALSQACGVSRSMLSEIERGRVNPTLAVTVAIAKAFGLSIGEFLDNARPASNLTVIRKADRSYHYRSDDDVKIRTLSPLFLEKDVEFYELTLNPASTLKSAAHYAGTREFLTVEKGKIKVSSGAEEVELDAGDSVSYRADVPHAITNRGSSIAVVFLVDIYKS